MQRYRRVKLVEGRGSGMWSAILGFSSLVSTSGSCSLQSPFSVTVKSCFEFSSGARGPLAAGSPDSLCLCSVTSLVPCLGISSCWGLPWSTEISIYYQHLYLLTVSLGRVLLQNLTLFDLIEKLQEAAESGQHGSGQGVTAPLLELGLVIGNRQDLQYPGKETSAHLM